MIFSRKSLVVTHNGPFHTDDVFAVATLSLLLDGKIRVVRSRDEKDFDRADYVVDVGTVYDASRQRFDHHQKGGAGERENGVPYASFGLVWKEYGVALCGDASIADRIDRDLVQFVDAMDNGTGRSVPVQAEAYAFDICHVISSYNPTWKEERSADKAFGEAVNLACSILSRRIETCADGLEGAKVAEAAYAAAADKRLVVLERGVPWKEALISKPEPLYVVSLRDDAQWNVSAVQAALVGFDLRKPLPESWAGKQGADLAAATGVPDAVFCHTKRFLAVAKSKEGALALAKKALEA